MGVTLRAETDDDLGWLETLYASTRADELAALGWPEALRARFVADQFAAQRRHYLAHMPRADRLIVVRGGADVGRLYVDRTVAPWRLVDIALLPEARGAGLGAALIRLLQRDARAVGIDLHVARDNTRAAALYARLGFARVDSGSATHDRMLWRPRVS